MLKRERESMRVQMHWHCTLQTLALVRFFSKKKKHLHWLAVQAQALS
jgi:hypothetical protein